MPLITCGEFTIDYMDVGEGPPVILIPSSGSGNRQWRKLVGELSDRYRMLSMNLFGYGETSPWPKNKRQTLKDQATLVIAIAEMLEEPVRLVGHSFGGSVAMKVALNLNERVKRLTLIEPNPFYLLNDHGRMEAYREIKILGEFVKKFGNVGEWTKVAAHFVDYWNSEGSWELLSNQQRANLTEMVKPILYEWDAVLGCEDDISEWQKFVGRMLVLKGADTRRAISEIVELLKINLPDLEVLDIPNSGHMLPVSHPKLVNPIIAEFLDRDIN